MRPLSLTAALLAAGFAVAPALGEEETTVTTTTETTTTTADAEATTAVTMESQENLSAEERELQRQREAATDDAVRASIGSAPGPASQSAVRAQGTSNAAVPGTGDRENRFDRAVREASLGERRVDLDAPATQPATQPAEGGTLAFPDAPAGGGEGETQSIRSTTDVGGGTALPPGDAIPGDAGNATRPRLGDTLDADTPTIREQNRPDYSTGGSSVTSDNDGYDNNYRDGDNRYRDNDGRAQIRTTDPNLRPGEQPNRPVDGGGVNVESTDQQVREQPRNEGNSAGSDNNAATDTGNSNSAGAASGSGGDTGNSSSTGGSNGGGSSGGGGGGN